MSVTFPEVCVGQPIRHEALSVFPLFAGAANPVDYLLSDEGLASGAVAVEEVSQAGSVSDLLVENKGDIRVLFIEGEELVGAKQNRILNTSVLIAAKSKTKIPVSCVEAGRWGYKSHHFGSSGSCSPSKLRYFVKSSVSGSLKAGRGHRSDQGQVWNEVARQQQSLGTPSGTSAMSDTFLAYRGKVAEFRENLNYVEGATGLAVAIGKKVVAIDLFDKPTTCQKVWSRLLSGFVLDALEVPPEEGQVDSAEVEQTLKTAGGMPWQKTEPVGEGEEYRAESGSALHASALTFQESPVHVSVVMAG
jgi:hypothetical protein